MRNKHWSGFIYLLYIRIAEVAGIARYRAVDDHPPRTRDTSPIVFEEPAFLVAVCAI